MWPHEVLLPRCLLAVHGDRIQLEHLSQRDFLRVLAGERGLNLAGNAFPQLLCGFGADLLQERCQQPAANAPGHPEGTIELRRSTVEAAINVELLVDGRTVAAVLLCIPVG